MEPYIIEILISGHQQVLFVYSRQLPDTSEYLAYEVFQGERMIGTIYPLMNDDLQIDWASNDLISAALVAKIGEKIEAIDM